MEVLQEADELRTTLTWLMQQDTDAFLELMACYKLPKNTDAEQSVRRERIQETAKNAARAPLAAMRATAFAACWRQAASILTCSLS